ncbi:MAG: hypothetical protein Q9162_002475 [Coniocarpon cinnabarinum]
MAPTVLLKGGTLLLHDDDDHVTPTKSDVLVEGPKIIRIAPEIPTSKASTILDCHNKIISPGFIDTHHHVWQTQLKGQHANQTLRQYLSTGCFASFFYNAEDVFWGELSGTLEALDSGTTTVVDHSHANYSPDHSYAAVAATIASGIRSVFAYSPTPRAKCYKPKFELNFDVFPSWVMETFDKLAAHAPFANGRVLLGFGMDVGSFMPKEVLQPIFEHVVAAGAQLQTIHDTAGPSYASQTGRLYTLKEKGLLDPKMPTILSHANNLDAGAVSDLRQYNVWISNTPTSELQMGMVKVENPMPVALSDPALAPYSSIGIDCHSMASAFMPSQLRELMQATRIHRHHEIYKQGKWYRALDGSTRTGEGFPTTEQAFNVATLGGARATGLADRIGRIKEGFAADLVIWDCLSPSMLAAAEQDPLAAIIFHSSIRDISGVLVDGIVRKWDGRLLDIEVDSKALPGPLAKYHLPNRTEWSQVAAAVMNSRSRVYQEQEGVDWAQAEEAVAGVFNMNMETMVT